MLSGIRLAQPDDFEAIRLIGFEAIPEADLEEPLLAERRREAEQGLDVALRVFMRRALVRGWLSGSGPFG